VVRYIRRPVIWRIAHWDAVARAGRDIDLVETDPGANDLVKAKEQYALIWSDAESQAYYAALKARFKATVNESALASRDAAASAPS